jgi:hypothetical protein
MPECDVFHDPARQQITAHNQATHFQTQSECARRIVRVLGTVRACNEVRRTSVMDEFAEATSSGSLAQDLVGQVDNERVKQIVRIQKDT